MSATWINLNRRLNNTFVVAACSIGVGTIAALASVYAPIVLAAAASAITLAIALLVPALAIALVVVGAAAILFVDSQFLIGAVAALVAALLVFAPRRAESARQWRTPRLVSVFVAYLGVSWLITATQSSHIQPAQAIGLWGLQLLPLLLGFVLTRPVSELSVVQWVVVATAAVVSVLQITTPVEPGVMVQQGSIGASLTGNRNALGVLFLLALAIVVPRLHLRPRLTDLILVVAAAGLVVATAATLSRSSYVAAAGLALAFLLLRGWRVGAGVLLVALLIAPLTLGGGVSTFTEAVTRLTGTFSEGVLDVSSGARIDLWQAAIRGAIEQPIFGLGYHQFAPNLPELWSGSVSGLAIVSRAEDYAYAHNLYLTILSQGGVIGLLLLIAVIVSGVRDGLDATGNIRETALLSLAVIGAASLFGEPLLVAAVSVPLLVTNAMARMSLRPDEPTA